MTMWPGSWEAQAASSVTAGRSVLSHCGGTQRSGVGWAGSPCLGYMPHTGAHRSTPIAEALWGARQTKVPMRMPLRSPVPIACLSLCLLPCRGGGLADPLA